MIKTNVFFDFTDFQGGVPAEGVVREIYIYDTCWWCSLCNVQYRQYYEKTGSDHLDC